ncbi:hypothetical protein AB0N38_12150 [Micromonospora aurantiaca]|uniref:Uncharacterized protein n=1 Tax=Micromonospora aurantiaca (nom. illeg.) TaxID=47850 RepID=A0ABQ6U6B5_9ACTN|nr:MULTISPECIES: hypothetical protein [Micromonospora]KAB1096447.1 hypothetical protein F6X54_32920 [Micromonospora aurantiaca]MDG4755205.1 hypothetical protein [Micromonospora sp. WMMD718]UFN94781.1 hypothetical protein LF814_00980 [Micromonospora aurantiaca]
MTYRQIFDEAIGDAPPTTVDVDALVAREGRRRRRTVGAYASATAVLALALGVGVVVQPGASGGPAPAHSAASAAARTEPERLRAAMLAAFHREAPDLRWVQGASTGDRETWDGPVTDEPPWSVQRLQWESATGWLAVGVAARGEVRSYLNINVGRVRPGHTSGPDRCRPGEVTCRSFTGPGGELVVAHDAEGRNVAGPVTKRTVLRTVTVKRADGAFVSVQTVSSTDRHLMTVEEMAAVALDPEIRLG